MGGLPPRPDRFRKRSAHEIASAAISAETFLTSVRDPADGEIRYAVGYSGAGRKWVSQQKFEDIDRADAAAIVLAEFLGAKYRP